MGTPKWKGYGWTYSNSVIYVYQNYENISKNNFIGNYPTNGVELKSDKFYLYRTNIQNLQHLAYNAHLFKIYMPSNKIYELKFVAKNGANAFNSNNGYVYTGLKGIDYNSSMLIGYKSTTNFNNTFGVKSVDYFELGFGICGLSWINSGTYSIIDKTTHCPGWNYIDDNNPSKLNDIFLWYDDNTNDNFYPLNPTTNTEDLKFKDINYIYKYIDLEFFNLYMGFNKDLNSENCDENAGFKVYLSNTDPTSLEIISSTSSFNNYLSNSDFILGVTGSSIQQLGGSASFLGLNGNRYLVIVADKAKAGSTILQINLVIDGQYHEQNNKIFNMSQNFKISSILNGATYSSNSGVGNTVDNTISGSSVFSKIGNSKYNSGIWENGVWNNGWRSDDSVLEFFDIYKSVKTKSNLTWEIYIKGPSSEVSKLKINDKISIGNIVGIDINENRKLLKDYYKVISKEDNGINENTGYIKVQLETIFPLRRIEKDSDKHRIKITKKIWLSGAFLNGYFSGIWNYGLFRGYPKITEMYNTNWIDGIFNGGYFNSSRYINGEFINTEFMKGRLCLLFSVKHKLSVGDIITIDKTDKSINSIYDTDTRVVQIISDYKVLTDIIYGQKPKIAETGKYYTDYRNSLIQNVLLYSNNISKTTSSESMSSNAVFVYNSYMDLVYDNYSAVNIGKTLSILNKVSNKQYSENNLYGYPTFDILSSESKFRDSYSTNEFNYKLGSKYKLFNDFVGETSKFDKHFISDSDLSDIGWEYSVGTYSTGSLSRTENNGELYINGNELKINIINSFTGSIPIQSGDDYLYSVSDYTNSSENIIINIKNSSQNIKNRYTDKIENNRYSIVEFDLINFTNSQNSSYYYTPNISDSTGQIRTVLKDEPIIHFNNLNKVKRYSDSFNDMLLTDATYLPIVDNINHISTSKTKKIEYFYNKTNISMNIRGNGINGTNLTEIILNNIKFYEVDMIPFFKYFTENNINNSIQIPLQGIAPYIDYSIDNFEFIDNISIGVESISIQKVLNIYSGIVVGVNGLSTNNIGVVINTNLNINGTGVGATTSIIVTPNW